MINDETTVQQEKQTQKDHFAVRNALKDISKPHDQSYYFGMDIYGNKFPNHQLPTRV